MQQKEKPTLARVTYLWGSAAGKPESSEAPGLEGSSLAGRNVWVLLGAKWGRIGIWRFGITSIFARSIYMIIEKELE